MMVSDEEPKKRRKKIKKIETYVCKHGSKSVVSYDQVCRKRYHESVVKYNKQFLTELEAIERMQPSAYEQIRFHRLFAVTTLWPPLHTRKEIEYTMNILYKPNPKIGKRVEEILNKNF